MEKIRETVYHGTTRSNAGSIIEHGFLPSTKNIEWLGRGIYFFHYLGDASWWAKDQLRKPKNEKETAVIISTSISFDSSRLLDLDDRRQLQAFSDAFRRYLEITAKESGLQGSFSGQDKRVWCAACNVYRELHPEIAITKYTFSVSDGRFVFSPNQIQYCVSDSSIIDGMEIIEA